MSAGTVRESPLFFTVSVVDMVFGEDQSESHIVNLSTSFNAQIFNQLQAGASNCNIRFLIAVQNGTPAQTYVIANVGFRDVPP